MNRFVWVRTHRDIGTGCALQTPTCCFICTQHHCDQHNVQYCTVSESQLSPTIMSPTFCMAVFVLQVWRHPRRLLAKTSLRLVSCPPPSQAHELLRTPSAPLSSVELYYTLLCSAVQCRDDDHLQKNIYRTVSISLQYITTRRRCSRVEKSREELCKASTPLQH